MQDLHICGAGVRRGSEDGISIWRGATFWASKGYLFLYRDHFIYTCSAHIPARDDHPGVFPFLVKPGKQLAVVYQRIRLCNTSLISFVFIYKAALYSCPSIRSYLRCCFVSDAYLYRMPFYLLVSTPAACNQIELNYTIYSFCIANPNNQPDILSPFTIGDSQISQKRLLVPTR